MSLFRSMFTKHTAPDVASMFFSAEEILNVDLRHSSNRESVALRRIIVNHLMDEFGLTPSGLHRELTSANITGQGLSRRSLNWYRNTQSEILTSNPGAATSYTSKYNEVVATLNSNL